MNESPAPVVSTVVTGNAGTCRTSPFSIVIAPSAPSFATTRVRPFASRRMPSTGSSLPVIARSSTSFGKKRSVCVERLAEAPVPLLVRVVAGVERRRQAGGLRACEEIGEVRPQTLLEEEGRGVQVVEAGHRGGRDVLALSAR